MLGRSCLTEVRGALMGRKALAGQLVSQLTVEEGVPAGPLLRRGAATVDFDVARRRPARFDSHPGQPSVDPMVLFKMALLGYLDGLPSERRLVDELRVKLAYRWFIGYDLAEAIPAHSVLSQARRRCGPPLYEAFFTDVVRPGERAGLIRGDRLVLDSTRVAAHADLGRVGSRELIRPGSTVGEHVAELGAENPEVASGALVDPTTPASAPGAVQSANGGGPGVAEAVAEPVNEAGERGGLHGAGPDAPPNPGLEWLNDRRVSRTAPDATVVQRATVSADLDDTVHVGVDGGQARISTAVEATTGLGGDELLLPRLVAEHAGNTPRSVVEVAADTKYGPVDHDQGLEERDVRAAIPFSEGGSDHRRIPRSAVLSAPETAPSRCPTGALLTRQGRTTTPAAQPLSLYRPRPAAGAACPLQQPCCRTAKVRSVSRPDDGGLRDRPVASLGTGPARRLSRQRKAWGETVFGDGKERRGLRRARGRGRDAVRIQALLTATAQTIRTLALPPRPGPVPGPAKAPSATPHRLPPRRWRGRTAPCPPLRSARRHGSPQPGLRHSRP